MPCFKGLAVSVHTPDGPIAEHSIQKQTRASRITAYIPVPPARIPADSLTGKPEQSTFAVSITLLTPGLKVPYSAPKPSAEDPYPQGRVVGSLPGHMSGERGKYSPVIAPYIPRTISVNETLAAYIYFDGRAKEEVATLLRRGEETWVNSRWVSVPSTEGGGLAEREFLFREVGLERWLNGLDLEGKDKAARIEKRHQRIEKKRRQKKEELSDDDEEKKKPSVDSNGVLRYGSDNKSPMESVMNEDSLFSSDSDDSDDPPQPEAAGQIKVALFRVLASGEVKRGEYSPQFDAHDDDEGTERDDGGGGGDDLDHTTSFAKPKSLDPKSISTQTVTGLDAPDQPYAVFTFFYRGEKSLQKMGILPSAASAHQTPASAKRKSIATTDFSKLGPLKNFGTVGFSGYREAAPRRRKQAKDDDAMDSDADDDDEPIREADDVELKDGFLSPEDARKQGELEEGVRKIKLKRVHSAEGLNDTRKSPHLKTASDSPTSGTPTSINSMTATAGTPPDGPSPQLQHLLEDPESMIASPFKKQRASMGGGAASGMSFTPLDAAQNDGSALEMASPVEGSASAAGAPPTPVPTSELVSADAVALPAPGADEDEEL